MIRVICLAPLMLVVQAACATAGGAQPAAVARIDAEYARTEAEAAGYRATERELEGFSLEGGELRAFYRGSELRKLSAVLFGESGRLTNTYYYAGGRPVLIHSVREEYVEPFGEGGVRATFEDRMYLDGDSVIHQVRSRYPADAQDGGDADRTAAELLADARIFAACAAAPPGPGRPECAPPVP